MSERDGNETQLFDVRDFDLQRDGNLLDDAYETRVAGLIDELVWMATTLRWGRANLSSKYHS